MKKLMPLFLLGLLFVACEDVETNTPAFQADIDGSFYKAYGSYAVINNDENSISITGLSDDQELMVQVGGRGVRSYELTPNSKSFAKYTDKNGRVYDTRSDGSSGTITLIKKNYNRSEITGSFEFTSVEPGIDTLVVHKGYFYSVPFTFENVEE